jgi:hypothetical protein
LNRDAIKTALSRMGQGLSSGDAVVLAEAWGLPATIFFDSQVTVANTPAQLGDIFKRAIQGLRKRDLASTRPEIEHVDEINPKLAAVRVRWPAFDRDGVERSADRAFYMIEENAEGRVRIRVAATIAE